MSNAIRNRIESLDVLIQRVRRQHASYESGHIILSSSNGTARFYKASEDQENCKRRIYLKDEKQIRSLCNKLYAERLEDAASREIQQLRKSLAHIQDKGPVSDIDKVYETMPEAIRKYVVPDTTTEIGFAQKWQAQKVACAPKTSAHIYQTIRGDLVRSKSEALIADRLYASGIPYRYEQVLVIDERLAFNIFPDFRILNKRTRKEIIWEHCGMMDDPKYCKDALERIDLLGEKGFIQGKNLIFTYECSLKPLNLDYVNKLIKQFLV